MRFCDLLARRGSLGSVLLIGAPLLGACSSAPPQADSPSAGSASASPATGKDTTKSFTSTWLAEVSIDQKFTTLFESPEVAAAGQRLWERLEADRELQRAGDAIVARLTESPQFAELARSLAKEHPDWGEAEFGAHFSAAVAESTERPEYEQAFKHFAETPSARAALQTWAHSLIVGNQLSLALGQFLAEPDWHKIWQRRVGPTTDSAELVRLLDTYLVSDAGNEDAVAIGHAVLDDPRLPRLLAELADSPILTRILVKQCRKLMQDTNFQRGATSAMLSVFARDPWKVQSRKLEELILAAPVQKMLEGVLLDLAAQRELHDLVILRMSAILGDLKDNEKLHKQLSLEKI